MTTPGMSESGPDATTSIRPARRGASPVRCAAASGALGALAAGLVWSFAYATDAASGFVIGGAHAAGGALLGLAIGAAASRLAPPLWASGLAGWLLGFAVPAAAGSLVPVAAETRAAAGITALLGIVTLAVAIALARLGRVAVGLALAGTGVAAAWLLGQGVEGRLPAHPVATVELDPPAAGRLAVIGLDSADWRVIDPLLAAGELPNLARLVERGRTAELLSFEPSDSPVVWTTIFSGHHPRDHGIDDWATSHAANRRRAVLWEMLAGAGGASVVLNVPGSWPPTDVRGALVSGFPIPSVLLRPDRERVQNVGSIVALAARPGPLRTTVARPDGDGALRARVSLGQRVPRPRTKALRHFLLEYASTNGLLPTRHVTVDVVVRQRATGAVLDLEIGPQAIALEPASWTPWLALDTTPESLAIRVRRLDDDALWVTPAFQSPASPVHPFTSSAAVRDAIARQGMYVVEPAGWRAVEDPGVRAALFEHLVGVERQHVRATLGLLGLVADWRLLAHVVTLPDRVSHAFWRFHEPGAYPPLPPGELAASRSVVADAYRESDRLLGELIARLDPDTNLLVVSDHGTVAGAPPYGTHRPEGVLIAAGPGIAAGRERLVMSILDVTPVALALLGMPAAEDLPGEVPPGLLAPAADPGTISSYEAGGARQPAAAETIDETTREQLRGLGYVE